MGNGGCAEINGDQHPEPRIQYPAMSTSIHKVFHLETAHWLPNVPAEHKCRRMQGHSFKVEIHVAGAVGEDSGWIMDFADLSTAFEPLFEALDHHGLNDVAGPRKSDQRESGRLGLGPAEALASAAQPSRGTRKLHQWMRLPRQALSGS